MLLFTHLFLILFAHWWRTAAPKREPSIINVFEVCCITANFILELRALQTSPDHMLAHMGCFGGTSQPYSELTRHDFGSWLNWTSHYIPLKSTSVIGLLTLITDGSLLGAEYLIYINIKYRIHSLQKENHQFPLLSQGLWFLIALLLHALALHLSFPSQCLEHPLGSLKLRP